jgi:acyl-CoA synthetase (AMP-forming)/AMP-acid ligase II
MASVTSIVDTYDLGPEDASLLVMPLFHVHGLIGVCLSTLHSGGTLVIEPRFSAGRFWRDALEHSVTWYSAVPTIHQVLVQRADGDGAPRGALRFIRSCSAPLAPATMRVLEDRFETPVLQAYGMTEAAHQVASNPLPPLGRLPGTVGLATGGEVAVLDESGDPLAAGVPGEVAIRGPNVMGGYHRNPDANKAAFANGWFRTGDQGFVDGRGYLTLTGRIKELINRGGEKISPAEVDAILLEHSSVAEAAVFGVPDPKYGEEIHAAIVLKKPATADEILCFCRERLAEFKVPKVVYFADTLPRGDTGKIQRTLIARRFCP